MVDVTSRPEGGFLVAHGGIGIPCATRRIVRIVKLLIIEDLYDADWAAKVLNTYGARVPHRGEKKRRKR